MDLYTKFLEVMVQGGNYETCISETESILGRTFTDDVLEQLYFIYYEFKGEMDEDIVSFNTFIKNETNIFQSFRSFYLVGKYQKKLDDLLGITNDNSYLY